MHGFVEWSDSEHLHEFSMDEKIFFFLLENS